MKPSHGRNDLPTSRADPGEFDGGLDGFSARIAEERPVELARRDRCELGQILGSDIVVENLGAGDRVRACWLIASTMAG